jgi:hypothetical protein
MVMPEYQKFAGMEVNQHSGETLALNVPAQHTHSFTVPCSQYKKFTAQFPVQKIHSPVHKIYIEYTKTRTMFPAYNNRIETIILTDNVNYVCDHININHN